MGYLPGIVDNVLQSNLATSKCECACIPSPSRRLLQVRGRHLSGTNYPTWSQFVSVYIFWPAVAQIMVTILLICLSPIYRRWFDRKKNFYHFIRRYIGTAERPHVEKPSFMLICYLCQLAGSLISVTVFAIRTYEHNQPSTLEHVLEICIALFFLFHYFILRLVDGFRPMSAWAIDAFVDNLTIIPIVFPMTMHLKEVPENVRWLSLMFLRSYRALLAYQRLERTVDLREFSDFGRAAFLSALRFIALVVCMGGTILILEILGEIPGWEDQPIPTAMGNLSFSQMIYWIFTTISTVGYGDFSPKTIPSRLTICIFIVIGILFFGAESEALGQLKQKRDTGKGNYIPESEGSIHIVITGTGAGKMSSMLETFMLETLDPTTEIITPCIVLLSEAEEGFDDDLRAFIKRLPATMKKRVVMLLGTAMLRKDLERVRAKNASMIFIIPDVTAPNSYEADGQNTMRALHIMSVCPKVRLRLMLMEPDGQARAISVGVAPERCYSAYELKCSILALTTMCKGLLATLASLLQETTEFEINEFSKSHHENIWFKEYKWGLQWTLHGFVIDPKFIGKPCGEFAAEVYRNSDGRVLVIAAQHNGHLYINWAGEMSANQICIAITDTKASLEQFSDPEQIWRHRFAMARCAQRHLVPHSQHQKSKNYHRKRLHRITCSENSMVHKELIADSTAASAIGSYVGAAHLERIFQSPNFVLVLVLGSGHSVWQQVAACITAFRLQGQPSHQPVVVMSYASPPNDFVKEWSHRNVVFLTGNLLVKQNLFLSGVTKAHSIIVLNSQATEVFQGSDGVLKDHEAVVLAALIEELCEQESSPAAGHFNVYEFSSTDSLCVLETTVRLALVCPSPSHHLMNMMSEVKHMERQSTFRKSKVETMRNDLYELIKPLMTTLWVFKIFLRTIFCNEADSDVSPELEAAASKKLVMQRRFAAGQVFTPDFYGCLMGHIFHFPATIEFVEALVMPDRLNQTSHVWQVSVPPEWLGKEYSSLSEAWIAGKDTKLGLCGTVIPFAIYRSYTDLNELSIPGCNGFQITLPKRSEILRAADLITVFATPEFAKVMASRLLLRGAEDHGKTMAS